MTKQEFMKIANAMRTYFPRFEILPNKEALELWYMELKDIEYEIAVTALRRYVATNKFPPSIAEIREQTAAVMDRSLEDDWGISWSQVTRAIQNYGMWSTDKALESMDEITRECVARLGWKELCMSESPMADRANFRMIYEQIKTKKREVAAMPLEVKENIQRIQGGLKMIGGTE
ncbi:MAG: replicative helicase loader/inhibitor [Anaerovoracaceae bacterium]